MTNPEENPGTPNVLTPFRARAGAATPVPMRLNMTITGSQQLRSLMAKSLGALPPLTTLMSSDLGMNSLLSITCQSQPVLAGRDRRNSRTDYGFRIKADNENYPGYLLNVTIRP
jgi:hypothetical protein